MSDHIETVIAKWIEDSGYDDMGMEPGELLAALKDARIELVELPEPYPDETIHPYWTVDDVSGRQVVRVTDSDTEGAWVSIDFTARCRTVDVDTARALGAAFFAAADAAVGARITVEEA